MATNVDLSSTEKHHWFGSNQLSMMTDQVELKSAKRMKKRDYSGTRRRLQDLDQISLEITRSLQI